MRSSRLAVLALTLAGLIAAPVSAQTNASDDAAEGAGPFAEPPPAYDWVFEPPSARVAQSMTDEGLRSMLDHMVEQL